MSLNEYRSFNSKLAFHAAPTLLGIKCASLISLSSEEFDIRSHSDYFNSKAAVKGLMIKALCSCKNRTLILLYNEAKLKARLACPDTAYMLSGFGYDNNSPLDAKLDRLAARISESESFPHEIGLFLDYPSEDVKGFIENKGENFKLCGCWKVYGCPEKARRIFTNYDKCRSFLCNKLSEGVDLYQALRIS